MKNQTVNYVSLVSASKKYFYTPETLINWIKRKQIKGKKCAGKWYVEKESLEQKINFIEQGFN